MNPRIFHVSEVAGIEEFIPRESPSFFENLNENVVFGIGERPLHNYLLPRECPRVAYYATSQTNTEDRIAYCRGEATYHIFLREDWRDIITTTTLYCYEFDTSHFRLLDKIADYYVSSKTENPIGVIKISNILDELMQRKNVAVNFVDDLNKIAAQIKKSTLHYSLIRMRNNRAPF